METQIKPEPLKTIKETDRQLITPFIWFNNQAEEAADFYASIFKNARVKTKTYYSKPGAEISGTKEGSVMTVAFQLEGYEFVALNGGPQYEPSPAISFMINCRTKEKIDDLWSKLGEDGIIMMPLENYPFSERYGWVQDKFGVSWQLILGNDNQIIAPCIMFTHNQHGKAEEAMNFYMSVFKNSAVERIEKYIEGEEGPTGMVKYGAFSLNGQNFKVMDSGREVTFTINPFISFAVNCIDQQEIDYYWEKLTEDSDENAQVCGWLKDKYDVSWQIVPESLPIMMSDHNSEGAKRVTEALLKMKKLDISTLKKAYLEDGSSSTSIDFEETATNYSGMSKDSLSPNEEL